MTRTRYIILTVAAVIGIAASSMVPTAPRLVWNASASVPIGFYSIAPAGRLGTTDLVAVMPPEPLAGFMVERGYIGRGVPLLKRVLALPGQQVCRIGRDILVDGIAVGSALARDHLGREMPVWQGCGIIADGELFLMNPDARDSLDGRYFGALPASAVIGRATPLYTNEDGNGRFVWCAPTDDGASPSIPTATKEETIMPPIRANLFRDDDHGNAWWLHWNRPQKRAGKD